MMLPGLLPMVPTAAVAVAEADELQVRLGLMACPALSKTSATNGCALPVLKVNDVAEELASCTIMEATGHVR